MEKQTKTHKGKDKKPKFTVKCQHCGPISGAEVQRQRKKSPLTGGWEVFQESFREEVEVGTECDKQEGVGRQKAGGWQSRQGPVINKGLEREWRERDRASAKDLL